MAITVTHSKVSTIPDGDDSSLIRPSDWNDDHVLTGTIPVANGGTGASTLTGYVKGNGTSTMTASSTIPNTDITGLGTASTKNAGSANGVATLDSGGKVPVSELPAAVLGALSYQGTWNASTNTPTLTSSVGTKGYYYVVNVAGTTDLNGITDWQVGDWAVYNGTAWQKIDNTDSVTSVNGLTGTVVLTTTNIAEGTNEYFTTSRARNAISAGTGLNYNSTTGAMNFSDSAVGTWAATPSSANLKAAMTDETGSGALVFGTQPTLSKPSIDGTDPYIQFFNGAAVTSAAGRMWYNGNDGTLNFGMGGGNITQQVGEELFVYGKASATIADSPLQIVVKTGTVGASGVITFAPAGTGITDTGVFVGCATEPIASGSFGRVTCFGVIHGIDTTGSTYGETWAANDTIWYNPATGNPTKVKPSAPNIKVQLGLVINVSATLGSFQVDIIHGSSLGGTDDNVQLSSPTAANLLTYSTTDGYWKNTALAAGTGISVGNAASGVVTVTNSAPDQTVAISSGTGISVTGTYPNFTVTNTAPSSGGTVTSVTGTAPVVSSGGTTPAISMAKATGSVDGYLSSTDWTTFNNKGSGTVTSVGGTGTVNGITLSGTVTSSGNLTLGGTLSGVSLSTQVTGTLPVANGGTGATSATAYSVLCGGTTSTGAFQSVASVGSSGQVLTSAGAGALPTWQTPAGGFAAGTAILFYQASAPTGWTKSTTNDNKALRVVSGSTGGSAGGSVAFTTAFASQAVSGSVGTSGATSAGGTVGATTLSESQMPSHNHQGGTAAEPVGRIFGAGPNTGVYRIGLVGETFNTPLTSSTGGGGSHDHSFSGSSHTHSGGTFTGTAINLAVQYIDVIVCTKD